MKNVLVLIFLCLGTSVLAQKIKLIEGDLGALKGQTSLKTEFKYDMSVGKFDKEADYIGGKKKELNEKRTRTWRQLGEKLDC